MESRGNGEHQGRKLEANARNLSLGLIASGGWDQAAESGVEAIAPWHHSCQYYSAASIHSDLNVEVVDKLVVGNGLQSRAPGAVLVHVCTWPA